MTDIWVVTATYGPESDIDPLIAVGWTKEAALELMEEYITLAGDQGVAADRDLWIVQDPSLMPVGGEPPEPPAWWRSEMFTEAESERIVVAMMDEVHDDVRSYAQAECDKMSLEECIGYVDEAPDLTLSYLKSIRDGKLAENWKPDAEERSTVKFTKRFGLVDDTVPAVTPRGFEYLRIWWPQYNVDPLEP